MPIYLIRHGETPLNVARVLQPSDTPLSAQGLAQAEAVAQRLASVGAAALLSSDLPRALQTAQAIAHATGLPLTTSPGLQERNFGALRGLPYDGLGFDPLQLDAAPEGGESATEFQTRVAHAFAHLLASRAVCGGPLLVVTHGLVIRALLNHHLHLPPGLTRPQRLGNTGLTQFDVAAPHTVRLLDCTSHLGTHTQDNSAALSGG